MKPSVLPVASLRFKLIMLPFLIDLPGLEVESRFAPGRFWSSVAEQLTFWFYILTPTDLLERRRGEAGDVALL